MLTRQRRKRRHPDIENSMCKIPAREDVRKKVNGKSMVDHGADDAAGVCVCVCVEGRGRGGHCISHGSFRPHEEIYIFQRKMAIEGRTLSWGLSNELICL